MGTEGMGSGQTARSDVDTAARRPRWRSELARVFLVESGKAAARWIVGAVALGGTSAATWLLGAPALVQGVLLGFVAFSLLPPIVGLVILLRHAARAGREAAVLKAERDDAVQRTATLGEELEQLRGRCDLLEADYEQSERTDKVLGDWLLALLIDPFPVRARDPDQSYQDLLTRTSKNVLPVLFPGNEFVATAVVRQEYDEGDFVFEITHRSPGVPEQLLDLSPVRSRYDFRTCVMRHTPDAVSFDFVFENTRYWVVAFPEQLPLHPVKQAPLMAVAAMLAHIFMALPREQ